MLNLLANLYSRIIELSRFHTLGFVPFQTAGFFSGSEPSFLCADARATIRVAPSCFLPTRAMDRRRARSRPRVFAVLACLAAICANTRCCFGRPIVSRIEGQTQDFNCDSENVASVSTCYRDGEACTVSTRVNGGALCILCASQATAAEGCRPQVADAPPSQPRERKAATVTTTTVTTTTQAAAEQEFMGWALALGLVLSFLLAGSFMFCEVKLHWCGIKAAKIGPEAIAARVEQDQLLHAIADAKPEELSHEKGPDVGDTDALQIVMQSMSAVTYKTRERAPAKQV